VYSLAIDMFAKSGDTKGAVEIFKEMRREKVPPNLVTYTSLMEAFLRAGLPSAALSISDEMLKAGFQYDAASYVWRLKCFVELNDIEVRAVGGCMRGGCVAPGPDPLPALIHHEVPHCVAPRSI
jgi:pentatricopeptide repeat protein